MKKLIIWVFLLACLTVTSVNAQVFLIERGTSSFTYPNIKAAVDALQDGDKLYLPPGIFSLTGYNWTGVTGTQNYSNTVLLVFVNTGLLIQTKNGLLYTIWNMGILTNTHSQIRLT